MADGPFPGTSAGFRIFDNLANAAVNAFSAYDRSHNNSAYIQKLGYDGLDFIQNGIDQAKTTDPQALASVTTKAAAEWQKRIDADLRLDADEKLAAMNQIRPALAKLHNTFQGAVNDQALASESSNLSDVAVKNALASGDTSMIDETIDDAFKEGGYKINAPRILSPLAYNATPEEIDAAQKQSGWGQPVKLQFQRSDQDISAMKEAAHQDYWSRQVQAAVRVGDITGANKIIAQSELNPANKKVMTGLVDDAMKTFQTSSSLATTKWVGETNTTVYNAFAQVDQTKDVKTGKATDAEGLQTIQAAVQQATAEVAAAGTKLAARTMSKETYDSLVDKQKEWSQLYEHLKSAQLEKKIPPELDGELQRKISSVELSLRSNTIINSQARSQAILDLQKSLSADPRFKPYLGTAMTATNRLLGLVDAKADTNSEFIYKLAQDYAKKNENNPALAARATSMAQELLNDLAQKSSAGGKSANAIQFDNNTIQNAWNNKVSIETGNWGDTFKVLNPDFTQSVESSPMDRKNVDILGVGLGDANTVSDAEKVIKFFNAGGAYNYDRFPPLTKQKVDQRAQQITAFVKKAGVDTDNFIRKADDVGFGDLGRTSGQLVIRMTDTKTKETRYYRFYDNPQNANLMDLYQVDASGKVGQPVEILPNKKDWRNLTTQPKKDKP